LADRSHRFSFPAFSAYGLVTVFIIENYTLAGWFSPPGVWHVTCVLRGMSDHAVMGANTYEWS
jgi:hypothetical protein